MDWSPVVQACIGLLAAAITGLSAFVTMVLLPKIIATYEKNTDIKLTAEQKASIYSAAETEANLLKAAVNNGVVDIIAATNPNSPVMEEHARIALNRVPESAAAQNTTNTGMRQIIAGRVASKIAATPARGLAIFTPKEIRDA